MSVIGAPVAPELKLTPPVPVVIVVTPDCVIAPFAIIVSVLAALPIDTVPSVSVLISVMATLPPVLVTATGPVKSFAWVSVTAPAPVVKLAPAAPLACRMAPVCVMLFAPVAVTDSVPLPTLDGPSTIALASVIVTLFAPLLFSDTAPVKSLVPVFSVIANAPVVKFAVPGTVNAPAWEMMPPAVTDKLPPACKVVAGNETAALSNCSVRLRRFVNDPILVGTVDDALISRNPTSRMLASVPPNAIVPLRLFACVLSSMSLLATDEAMVTAPADAACVIAPFCVMPPPAVSPSVPAPTDEVPTTSAAEFVSATLLAPLLFSDTAPVKLLVGCARLMAPAFALTVVVPPTVSVPPL